MPTPFCSRCGAPIGEGNRFCMKCGQPAAQILPAVPPPLPPAPASIEPEAPGGAALWVGLVAALLVVSGAGLWFYSNRSTSHSPAVPQPATSVPAEPVLATPDAALVDAPPPVLAPVKPTPSHRQAPAAEPRRVDPDPPPSQPPVIAPTAPNPLAPPTTPASGVLHYSGPPVPQNGEVVFDDLPGARLKFTFDNRAWQPIITRQVNGTQRLILRSMKPGMQTHCDVKWEIVQ